MSDVFKEDTGDWPYRESDSAFSRLPAAQQDAGREPVSPESTAPEVAPPPAPSEDAVPEPPVAGAVEVEPAPAPVRVVEQEPAGEPDAVSEPDADAGAVALPGEEPGEASVDVAEEGAVQPDEADHAAGGIDFPAGVAVVQGAPTGERRTVGVVVGRFNGEITNRLLARAVGELEAAGVVAGAITVVPVPGAFELPLAAMALAKTRKFSCVIALGCVIRGETPHFDFVAGEAASGLQLAALETGVPVAFGLLTCETKEQAEARVEKGAEAARAALEMADLFSQVRMQAAGR